MLNPSLRDIQYRKTRFAFAVLGVALLFTLILVMDGIAAGMSDALTHYLKDSKADAWAIQEDTEGPFTGFSVLQENTAAGIRKIRGVRRAEPFILTPQNAKVKSKNERIYLVGQKAKSMLSPRLLVSGRGIRDEGEVVIDESLKIKIGDKMRIAGREFKVVGRSGNTTYSFNLPIVFMSLSDAQSVLFNNQPMISAVALTKSPGRSLADIRDEVAELNGADAKTQKQMLVTVMKQLEQPLQAINFFKNMFWFVGALIVAMIVYVTAMERTQDFAVFKAIGATNAYVARLVVIQALLISLFAAAAAAVLANLLAPVFPLKMTIQQASLVSMPIIATAVSILSSLAAIRRATTVDPAVAFGGR